METPIYLDFDLQITATANGYRAHVFNSPVGQATVDFHLPFTNSELKSMLGRFLQPASLASRAFEQETVKPFGTQLFTALFQGELLACFGRSVDAARRQNAGLRIRLRFADTPELAHLPWEYLHDPTANRFLTLSSATPLVHYVEMAEPVRPLAVATPLRILAVIASPSDQPALNVEQEWQNVQTALNPLVRRGQVIIDRLQPSTLPTLQSILRRNEYHIFHFIGHSTFDEATQEGMLVLTDEAGRTALLSARHLGQLIHNEPTLALAVLNSCEGSRTAKADPFAGVAQTLVQQGVPAVIAMQFQISDPAAILFSQEFYAALADGYAVDAASTEARVAMATRLGGAEWGTPRLFLRAGSGHLWQIANQITAGKLGLGEQIHQDLGVLANLIQTPEVRATVIAFRTDFQAAGEQIDLLGNYKELHDLLHNLEFLCYNGLVQEARRFPQDETALGILTDHELTLQDLVRRLQDVASRPILLSEENGWISEIVEAQNQLQLALEQSDAELLKRAIWLLRRVLYRHPTRVNERLNAAARALRLAAIVQAMHTILEKVRQQPADRTPAQRERVQQFENGVQALMLLQQNLSARVSQHDRWQAVDLELRRIELSIGQDLMELEISWPGLQRMVEPLAPSETESKDIPKPQVAWIAAFQSDRLGLDGALKAQNPARARLYFQRFRRQVGNRFYQIDTELNALCMDLRQVCAPLASILHGAE